MNIKRNVPANRRRRLLSTTLMAGVAAIGLPAAVTVLASAAPTSVLAQSFTGGTLEGRVLTTDEAPVAGATVVVRSVERAGFERTLTTDANGVFRVPQVPIGAYSVSVTGPGIQPFTDNSVAVTLGSVSDYDFVVASEGEVEGVVVTGTRAGSDFDDTTTGLVVDVQETFDRVPTQRSMQAVQLLAPQTAPGDTAFSNFAAGQSEVSISGASVAENVYYINGMNITNFRNFVGGNTVPFAFYDQIQIKTGGYSAEFGRSTGGAVIATTRSGSDRFHGGFNYFTEPGDLRSTAPNTVFQRNESDERERTESDVWLSGPIWPGHIYFFGLYNWRDIVNTDENETGVVTTNTAEDPFYGGKLDLLLNDDHRVELTYFTDDQSQETQTLNPGDTTPGLTNTLLGGETKIAQYTGNFTDWFTLSVLYGENTYNQTVSGTKDAEISIVNELNQIVRGNPALLIEQGDDMRKLTRIDGDFYFKAWGEHHVRAGYDREDLTSVQTGSYSGGRYFRYFQTGAGGGLGGLVPPNTPYVRLRVLNQGGEFETQQSAYYIQDAWEFSDQLTLQLGLRFEKFNNLNAEGESFIETDYELSPRLGFTYDLFNNGQTILTGFFGRYYLPVAANTNIRLAGAELFTQDFFLFSAIGGTFPGTIAGLTACLAQATNNCLPTTTGAAILSEVLSPGTVSDPRSLVSQNIEAQHQDEVIIGISHRIGDWRFGARYLHRELKQVMEDFDTSFIIGNYCESVDISEDDCGALNNAGEYVLLNPGKDLVITPDPSAFPALAGKTITIPASIIDLPQARRQYNALELTAERPWDGRWQLNASYVLSESIGNIEGGVKSDNGQDDTGLTQDFDEPGWTDGSFGLLPNHHAHTIKLFGSFAVTPQLIAGANFFAQSGRHFGCIGAYPFDDGRASPTTITAWYCDGQLTPRGSQFQGEWQTRLDVSLAYTLEAPIPMLPDAQAQVRLDIFNLFNFQSATDYYEFGEESLGDRDENYQEPIVYQQPRYVRVGFSLEF